MTNKLTPLNEFIIFDDANEPILNEVGLPTFLPFPVTKTVEDVERVIALGKDLGVINVFAEQVALGEQWLWASQYYRYLVELNEVEQYNANLPDPVAAEYGTLVEVEPKAQPTSPVRPLVRTVDEVLEPYKITIFKLQRQSQIDNAVVKISTGKMFDADEQSITRMSNSLIKHWQLAEDDIILWSTADVGTGIMLECTKGEIIEAHQLATDNFAATWKIPN